MRALSGNTRAVVILRCFFVYNETAQLYTVMNSRTKHNVAARAFCCRLIYCTIPLDFYYSALSVELYAVYSADGEAQHVSLHIVEFFH